MVIDCSSEVGYAGAPPLGASDSTELRERNAAFIGEPHGRAPRARRAHRLNRASRTMLCAPPDLLGGPDMKQLKTSDFPDSISIQGLDN